MWAIVKLNPAKQLTKHISFYLWWFQKLVGCSLTEQDSSSLRSKCETYQTNEGPVSPAHHVRPVIRLAAVHDHPRHQHRSRLLVEPCTDMVDVGSGICPAVTAINVRLEVLSQILITSKHAKQFTLMVISEAGGTKNVSCLK